MSLSPSVIHLQDRFVQPSGAEAQRHPAAIHQAAARLFRAIPHALLGLDGTAWLREAVNRGGEKGRGAGERQCDKSILKDTPQRAAAYGSRSGPDYAQVWLRCGSDVSQMCLRFGSDVAQVWLRCGSDVAQMWLRCGMVLSLICSEWLWCSGSKVSKLKTRGATAVTLRGTTTSSVTVSTWTHTNASVHRQSRGEGGRAVV